MTVRSYTCAKCGGIFTNDPDWTEADAEREQVANFGTVPADELAVICDDCYCAFMKWWNARQKSV